MATEALIDNGQAVERIAGETSFYILQAAEIRGGADLAFLLVDLGETVGLALNALWRGTSRAPLWRAVEMLAGDALIRCRAVGNDGQLGRCAAAVDALAQAIADYEARLALQEAQDATTDRPDPALPAPEDPHLTEAIKETFPASDPIAPSAPQ